MPQAIGLTPSERGLNLFLVGNDISLEADDIVMIEAYLTDNFTIDNLWLEIKDVHGAAYSVSEEVAGFECLVMWLIQQSLIGNQDWYSQATRPAFQKSNVVVFLRQDRPLPLGMGL